MTDLTEASLLAKPLALGQLNAVAQAIVPPASVSVNGSVPVSSPSLGPAFIPGLHSWTDGNANPALPTDTSIANFNKGQQAISKDQYYLFNDQNNYSSAELSSTSTNATLTTDQTLISRDQGDLVTDFATVIKENSNLPTPTDPNAVPTAGYTYPAYSPVTVTNAQVAYEAGGMVDKRHQLTNVHFSNHT